MKLNLSFAKPQMPADGVAVVLCDDKLALGAIAGALDQTAGGLVARAAAAGNFKGKEGSSLDLVLPAGLSLDRLVVVGIGKAEGRGESDWMKLGGTIMAKIGGLKAAAVTVVLERPDGAEIEGEEAAAFAAGMRLRAYDFDRYKTKKSEDEENGGEAVDVTIVVDRANKAKSAYKLLGGVCDGVIVARDLVNEPGNVLGPEEFADRAKKLEKLGVEVEVLGEKEMRKLKMDALLGVALGSARPPRLVVMRWNGVKGKDKPLVFVGKGVCFDSGGISLKPGAGMEDMKGDMGGAAAVTGLMHALAARKAKVDVIGIIGLVENMPDGKAQRPGDIVTSMSGQTIEIINTDAEGRLVLCDALWYAQERFEPRLVIDLATLTGAIMVALGHHHAGLFANDDDLAGQLARAGEATGEAVWRMPLGKDYDKLIDSKFADMKNTGGRWAGSITAAQFLKRFVKDGTPWAHLDVAGTAMGSPKTEISQSWSSGFGVRLLDRFVADNYEK